MKQIVLALLLLIPASAVNAGSDDIGSWHVTCPDQGAPTGCRLRHRVWILAPAAGRPSASLEVQSAHGALVPALAVRGIAIPGITIPAAAGAMLALSLQASIELGPGRPIPLPCLFADDTITCAPARDDAKAAASQLRQARTAILRVHLAEPANAKLSIPDQQRALDLRQTPEALGRLPPPAESDDRWDASDIIDWMARQAGFPGGREELLRWLLGQAAALPKP